MNIRAELLQRVRDGDGGGGIDGGWEVVAGFWIGVEALSGSEVFGPDLPEARGTYKAVLRRRDVSAGQRLRVGRRLFDIAWVQDGGPPDPFIVLRCEELP